MAVSSLLCKVPCGSSSLTLPETGTLFQLLARLMLAKATVNTSVNVNTLSMLLGRYFQIRDDYKNLMSADVSSLQVAIYQVHSSATNNT